MNDVFSPHSDGVRSFPAAGANLMDGTARIGGGRVPVLLQYLRIAVRRKWTILGTVAAALILGLIATLLMTPRYSASSTIEISRESNRVVEIKGVEAESGPGELEFYQTQYGLLRSRSLAERVARDLRLADDTKFFEMFGVSKYSESLEKGGTTNTNQRAARVRDAADILLENISISPVRLSRLVEVTFTSPDPVLSARVTNAWTAHFIESNLERRFEATSYARKFLEDRLTKLRQKLEESERILVGYAAKEKIINLPSAQTASGPMVERSIIADDLASLNSELGAATADMIRARSRVPNVGQSGAAREALTNDAISALRQRRAEVAAQYSEILVKFEPGYPAARALQTQLAQLDQSIAREENRIQTSLQSEYRASVERRNELESRVNNLKSSLLDLRRRSIQYNIYQREADTNRELYDGLLQRYKEIGIAGGVGTNNVAVVDRAGVPEEPSRPRLLVNLIIAFLGGLIAGLGIALALEQIDEAISDPEELSEQLNLPFLGVVPKIADGDPVEALNDRKSSLVEAYLSIQTNLAFSTDHGIPRSLSVTSTRPAEGKSTTSYALANALARAKRKTLLIDGDMRSPSIHHLFGVDNKSGLSNFLSGNSEIGALVRPAALDNLSIMTAGPLPPNAAELLTGDRFHQLLEVLLKTYDNVVIDSPPVLGLADAPLIASRVEGVIFAVESHGIRSSIVRVAVERLRSANAHILGAVLTKFETKRAQFGYGYDYGYSYGETSDRIAK